jgi:hypothetical protein
MFAGPTAQHKIEIKEGTYKMTKKAQFRIYLAGPMQLVNNFNMPLFDYVAEKLRKTDHCEVFSPADHAREKLGPLEKIQKMGKAELEYAIRTELFPDQIAWICRHADAMLMLPGWEHSEGAKIERQIALYFNKPVREADTILLIDEQDARHLGALALDLASAMP